MKCQCCKKSVDSSLCFNDGSISYCPDCVKTKKIDDSIHESEKVDWKYCENCKNIVPIKDYIGSCDMLIACKQITKDGFMNLCSDCGTKYDHSNDLENKTLTSCLFCTSYLKKIKK